MQFNLYAILGIKSEATIDEIKAAHRRMALRYHPDRNKDNATAQEFFKRIQLAFEVLSDEVRRKVYDKTGEYSDAADNADGPVIQCIQQIMFEMVIGPMLDNNIDPELEDVHRHLKENLKQQHDKFIKQIKKLNKQTIKIRKVAKRYKNNAGEENLMTSLIQAEADKIEKFAISLQTERVDVMVRAMELVEKFDYEFTKKLVDSRDERAGWQSFGTVHFNFGGSQ